MNNKVLYILIIALSLLIDGSTLLAQENNMVGGVSLSNDTLPPHPSAMLEVRSVSKGVVIPQMTLIERDNINQAADGLMVYVIDSTDFAGIWYYDNTEGWQQLKFRRAYYPMGSIIMYNGLVSGYFNSDGEGTHTSTLGWHVCNGNNGTPNLIDMFVVAYDANNSDYKNYGANSEAKNSYKLGYDDIPTHSHEITDTVLSQSFEHGHEIKNKDGVNSYIHTHNFKYIEGQHGKAGFELRRKAKTKKSKEYVFEESGLGLASEINSRTSIGNVDIVFGLDGEKNTQVIDNRPEYYSLVYIMRTSMPFSKFNEITNP